MAKHSKNSNRSKKEKNTRRANPIKKTNKPSRQRVTRVRLVKWIDPINKYKRIGYRTFFKQAMEKTSWTDIEMKFKLLESITNTDFTLVDVERYSSVYDVMLEAEILTSQREGDQLLDEAIISDLKNFNAYQNYKKCFLPLPKRKNNKVGSLEPNLIKTIIASNMVKKKSLLQMTDEYNERLGSPMKISRSTFERSIKAFKIAKYKRVSYIPSKQIKLNKFTVIVSS